ncbi:MAG: gliding motility-associated C-terminal domain-containing protein [Bacteroidetes bacterium]|nr:gliding motility-associated C-terminal domain-containing protein [Bacteroidota bacterium]
MKTFIMLMFSILMAASSYAQTPQWLITAGYTSDDVGYVTTISKNGNVLVAGQYTGTIDLDPSSSTYNITSYSSTQDMYLACYSPAGSFLWGFSLGKQDYDGINAITTDDSNNVFIGGYFRGTNVDFDPSSGGTAYLTCQGIIGSSGQPYGGDGFLAKYSSTGSYKWVMQFGTPYWVEAIDALSTDSAGNVYVGGVFKDTLDFDPSPTGSTVLNAATGGTIFLAKYTGDKQLVWVFNFGKPGSTSVNNSLRSLTTDSAGNVYITGFVEYTTSLDFDPSPTNTAYLYPVGNLDAYVAKYTTNGNYSFAFLLGTSSLEDMFSITLDSLRNIYVMGYTTANSIDLDPSSSTATVSLSGGGGTNIMLAKYSNSGTYQWGKMIGSSGNDFGYKLAVSKSRLNATGYFSGTVNFNPATSSAVNLTSAGGTDLFLAKYKLDGTYDCGFRLGSSTDDYGSGLAADTFGNMYISGGFSGTNTDFDPGAATTNATSAGGTDIFLVKYKWENAIPGYLIGDTVCQGEQAYLTYIDTAGNATAIIQYTSGSTTYKRTVQSGVPFPLSPNPTSTTSYVFSLSSVSCASSVTGNTVSVIVNPAPIANAGNDTGVCPTANVQLHGTGGGSYSWYSTSTIINPASATPTVTGYTAGTYNLVVTNAYGCKDTDDINITINPVPIANAGNDTTVCSVPSVQLYGSGGVSYSWYSTAAIVNANTATPLVSGTTIGTYYVIVANGYNCKDTDDVNVLVNPAPVANAGNDTAVCPTALVPLHGTGGNTYSWYGTSSVTNPLTANPTVSGYLTGTYYLVVTNSYNCKDTDDVNVVINPVPIADAGNDTAVCPAANVQLHGSGGGTYSWYGTSTITNAGTATPIVTGYVAGVYDLIVTNAYGCKDTDIVNVNINPVPAANAGSDTSLCPVSNVQLHGSGGGTYTWYSALPINNPNTQSPIVAGNVSGTYTLYVTNTFGCKDTDDVSVIVKPVPMASAGADTIVCQGASIRLDGSGGGTYYWYSGSPIADANLQNPVVTISKTQTFYLVVSNGSCTDTASVTISLRAKPTLFITPRTYDLCRGDSVSIVARGGDDYHWWPDSALTLLDNNRVSVSPRSNMIYKVAVFDKICGTSDTLFSVVTVRDLPNISVKKSNDITCSDNTTELSASGALKYQWYPDASLDDHLSPNVIASPESTIDYQVVGINQYGCADTAIISVNVKKEGALSLIIPDAFSPNNDGKNDCFQIYSNSAFVTYEFAIYNRWGQQVFHSNNINDCWDGKFKGVDAEMGTYSYFIKGNTSGCSNIFKKGMIHLLR